MIQESTTSINGKRDKVGVQPVINDPSTTVHDTILPDRSAQRNLLGLRSTGSRTGATRGDVNLATIIGPVQ